MKIFLIGTVSSSIFGFRKELLRTLVRRGHDVCIYVGECPTEIAIKAGIELGVVVRTYPLSRSGTNPGSDIRTLWFLWREFRREQPDSVLSYFAKPVVWGSLAAWLACVPMRIGMLEGLGYVFTEQPTQQISWKQRLLMAVQVLLYRVAIPRLDRMIFLNPDDSVDLLEAHGIKAKCVSVLGGIGVNLDELAYILPPIAGGATPGSISFIFVGRLLAEKGINEYVAAARLVKLRYPQARFVVLGGLDEENPGGLTQKELDVLILQGVVEHPGHVTNVAQWLRTSDVFVLPSYREGVPVSTQEAMAIGRAVITTDVPGCRETVVEGVNGFLVPSWNAAALAEKMIYLIEHPQQIIKMGEQSRHIAEQKFNEVEVSQRLCNFLEAV